MLEYDDPKTGEKKNFSVTPEELRKLNGGSDLASAYKDLKKLLSIADLNGNGSIEKDEFAKLALALRAKDPAKFKRGVEVEDNDKFLGIYFTPDYMGKENEFTLYDAISMSVYAENGKSITMDDVRRQDITGVMVTSRGVKR